MNTKEAREIKFCSNTKACPHRSVDVARALGFLEGYEVAVRDAAGKCWHRICYSAETVNMISIIHSDILDLVDEVKK